MFVLKEFIVGIKTICIVLIVIWSISSVQAHPNKFYNINTRYGISIRETNSVCEDQNGFIWASSRYGILRISEDEYHIYDLPVKTSGLIKVRLVFNNGRLLAHTNKGHIFKYNPVYDRFELIINLCTQVSNENLIVPCILMDGLGTLWISSSGGLYKYDKKELSLVNKSFTGRYLITWYDQDHLLITLTNGIWLFDIRSMSKKQIYDSGKLKISPVFPLLYDTMQNKLWIGTLSQGLLCYHFDSNTLSDILGSALPRQPIMDIEEYTDSTILIGIDGQGIWELDKKGRSILNIYKESADNPFSLRGNGVYDIFPGSDNRVWVCTFNGGLSYFVNESPIIKQIIHVPNNKNSLRDNGVNSVIEDHFGKIWFATNNGLSCWDVTSDQWINLYDNKLEQAQVFLTLCEDDSGRIWAGSYSSGVYVLDASTGKELEHYSHNGLPPVGDFIFEIFSALFAWYTERGRSGK